MRAQGAHVTQFAASDLSYLSRPFIYEVHFISDAICLADFTLDATVLPLQSPAPVDLRRWTICRLLVVGS